MQGLLSPDITRSFAQIGLGLILSVSVYELGKSNVRSLFKYFFTDPGREGPGWKLDFAPSDTGRADRTFLVLFGVVSKVVRGLFGLGPKLKVQKGVDNVELPRLELRCPVVVGDEHAELYRKAVAQSGGAQVDAKDESGLGQQFLLAATTNQLMLLLVVHPRLPVSPVGGVNVRNRIEFHSTSTGKSMTAHAYVGGKDDLARVVKRGIEFDIHIDVFDHSQQLILRQIVTILTPCKTHIISSSSTQQPSMMGKVDTIGEVEMTTSSPSLWCRVCGDYNPIHVSSTLAKLFGFKGKIAHGNHVVAKMLHLYASRGITLVEGGKGWWIEMQFRRPMVLPIRLQAQIEQVEGSQLGWQCVAEERGQEKVYVSGCISQM